MSALKILPPKKEYAPKYLHKFYDGYDPKLYAQIVKWWRECSRMDIKRFTALDYAKRAQEYDLEQKQEAEKAKYRGRTFIEVNDGWQEFFRSKEDFVSEFQKHLKALLLHLSTTFQYARKEVVVMVKGYNAYTNTPDQELWSKSLTDLIHGANHVDLFESVERVSGDIWDALMRGDDAHVQKRAIAGWKIYTHSKDTLFIIEFLYDPVLPDLIKEEEKRRYEEYHKNDRTANAMGYGGKPGSYTGD